MGRPRKIGLNLFTLETIMDPEKQRELLAFERDAGLEGYAIYTKIILLIYASDDGRLDLRAVDLEEHLDFAGAKISRKKAFAVVDKAVDAGLFDRDEYRRGILTSAVIKERFAKVLSGRQAERARKAAGKTKRKRTLVFEDVDAARADLLYEQIRKVDPAWFERSNVKFDRDAWANTFRMIRVLDQRTDEDVEFVLNNFPSHDFWAGNIRSPESLRGRTSSSKKDKFLTICQQLKNTHGKTRTVESIARSSEDFRARWKTGGNAQSR